MLRESDEDDSLGIQRILRFCGDLWAATGPVALIVFPILSIAFLGIAFAILILIERRFEKLSIYIFPPYIFPLAKPEQENA